MHINDIITTTLKKYLMASGGWYTGTSLKRFLKSQIFSEASVYNSSLKANRWLVYAHRDFAHTLAQLVDRLQTEKPGKTVLLHPLLPTVVQDVLDSYSIKCKYLSIDKFTTNLIFNEKTLNTYGDVCFCLVPLWYTIDENILSFITYCNSHSIPILWYIPTIHCTVHMLETVLQAQLGGVIFIDKHDYLGDVLHTTTQVRYKPVYTFFSWIYTHNTVSQLEYQKKLSSDSYIELFSAWYYYCNSINQSFKKAFSQIYERGWLGLAKNYTNPTQAQKKIQELESSLVTKIIPDAIFDILNEMNIRSYVNSDQDSIKLKKIHELYTHFEKRIAMNKPGTIMVPKMSSEIPTHFFLYFTTQPTIENPLLKKKGYTIEKIPVLHVHNEEVEFINQYGWIVLL